MPGLDDYPEKALQPVGWAGLIKPNPSYALYGFVAKCLKAAPVNEFQPFVFRMMDNTPERQ